MEPQPQPAQGAASPAFDDDVSIARFVGAGGSAPAPGGSFRDAGPSPSDLAYGPSDLDRAMKPVAMPAPEPKGPSRGKKVATDHAPSVGDVLAPQQPAMEDASQDDLVDSSKELVDQLYDDRLMDALGRLKKQLSSLPPPAETPIALQIIGAIVGGIATATVGMLGKLAVDALKDQLGSASGPVLDGIKSIGKEGGALVDRGTIGVLGDDSMPAIPGGSLLDEFFERERLQLLVRKDDIKNVLRLIRRSAARNMPHELATLHDKLREVIGAPALTTWFEHKTTMEWMNFCARLSLGPRTAGQTTDMPGANQLGGRRAAGPRGATAWIAGPDGSIDITLDVSLGSEGDTPEVQFLEARTGAGPGAATVLRSASNERDEHGAPYTLATLPVYRCVWLKTSDSRLDTTLAFVITPEGAIEANLDNATLASFGARLADGVPSADHSMLAAQMMLSGLRGVRTEQLQ